MISLSINHDLEAVCFISGKSTVVTFIPSWVLWEKF